MHIISIPFLFTVAESLNISNDRLVVLLAKGIRILDRVVEEVDQEYDEYDQHKTGNCTDHCVFHSVRCNRGVVDLCGVYRIDGTDTNCLLHILWCDLCQIVADRSSDLSILCRSIHFDSRGIGHRRDRKAGTDRSRCDLPTVIDVEIL